MLYSVALCYYHRRRHGFEVGGHNFFSVPQICVVPPPQFRDTAGAYHSQKTDIVKITGVKNKALLTWRLADIHDVCVSAAQILVYTREGQRERERVSERERDACDVSSCISSCLTL